MHYSDKTKEQIRLLYKNRSHVELTIGLLKNQKTYTVHYGPDRKRSSEKLLYPAGSIGKPLTAAFLARKVSEGVLNLDAPLNTYIDSLPEGAYPSLRLLATHHAGYGGVPHSLPQALICLARRNKPDGFFHTNPHHGFPDEAKMLEVLSHVRRENRSYPFSYSNFSYGVLGYILGKTQNQTYMSAMEGFLKNDLGLKDTSFTAVNMTGYDQKDQPALPWSWDERDIHAPAGAVVSSAEDLLRFASLQMDEAYPYLSLCHQAYEEGEKNAFRQGLAWRLKDDLSFHGGNAGAFSGFLALNRREKTAACVLMNYGLAPIEDLCFSLLSDLA